MWWRLVLSLVLWNTVTSQPIADEADNVRQTRELESVECCPCPGSGRAGEGYLLAAVGAADDARTADVDDCPCSLRDTDAEGAASGLLPARTVVRLLDSKEEPKPLLHPEVGLASSVLETLREATDEEYHDAVARDAVRSAIREETDSPSSGDTIPESAQNIVTIILNTKSSHDDIIAEASHVQEARCKPESADFQHEKIPEQEPPNLLKEIVTLHKTHQNGLFSKRKFDMHSGASNIDKYDSINKDVEGLKLKAHSSSLNLFANKGTTLQDKNLSSIFKLRDINTKLDKNTDGGGLSTHLISTKVPDSRLNPVFSKINKSDSLNSILEGIRKNKLNRPLIPKIKLVKSQKSVGDFGDIDNNPSPSNSQDQFSETKKTNDNSKFRFKSLIPSDDKSLETRPLRFKNLLKLKDVELISPKSNTAKVNIPDLKTKPALETNVLTSLTPRNWNHHGTSILNNKDPRGTGDCEMETKEINLQTIPEVKTEILDALPSASEDHQVVAEKEICTHDIDDDPTLSDPCIADQPNMENNTEDIVINDTNEAEEKEEQSHMSNDDNIESFLTNDDYSREDIVIQPETNYLPSSLNDDELVKDYLEDMDIDHDAVAETSNNVFQIASQAEIEDLDVDCLTDNDFKVKESCLEMVSDNLEDERLSEKSSILSTLKDNIFKNSDTLNKSSEFVESSSDEDNKKERSVNSSETSDPECQIEDSDLTIHATQISNEPSDEVSESTNQVNIENIQKMTDSLLNSSNQKTQNANNQDVFECKANTNNLSFTTKEVIENDTNSSSVDSKDASLTISDLDAATTSGDITIVNAASNPITSSREILEDDENLSAGYVVQKSTNEANQIKENDCYKLDFSKRASTPEIEIEIPESSSGKVQSKEMIADASDSVMKIMPRTNAKKENILGTSLLRDIIVQPSSLFSGNDFFKKPILDLGNILNLDTPLPVLDDLQSRISSIFGVSERDADDKELSSSEFDLKSDCSKSNPVMATDSSTTNFKSIFPSLKPIDDINLNIFQFSPLTQNEPFQSKLPGLNLNSYKARLALPKSINLKPLKLQSALRNQGGLLGATLTLGPEDIQSSRRMKPKLKSGSVLNRKPSEILTHPLGNMPNMPSLDGLRATMRANAENLLNTQTVTPKLLEETLRSSQVISENLRSHSENTMRNIQETLASTLHEARVKDLNVLGQKFAKPEDIFEIVSSARDDVNDKLYAIHTDLTDRLTSMHERIVDQSKLPSFNIPLRKETLSSKPQSKTNARIVQKPRSTIPKISHTSPLRKESLRKPTSSINKPSNLRLGSSQARAVTEQNKFKPYKMPKAASSLSPKTVEVPKLTTMSPKASFSTPLQRDASVRLRDSSPLTSADKDHGNKLFKNIKRPLIKQFKPFGEVKVSFSTTMRPIIEAKPTTISPISTSKFETKSTLFRNEKHPTATKSVSSKHRPDYKSRSTDLKAFASEPNSMRISASVKANRLKSETVPPEKLETSKESLIQSPVSSSGLNTKPLIFNLNSGRPNKFSAHSFKPKIALESEGVKTKTDAESPLSPFAWPSITENSFLYKVREAVKARLANVKPLQTSGTSRNSAIKSIADSDQDMARSASENKGVISSQEEPIKENVSYRCKMVCVREPIK